jgi:hypothetical protein
MASPGGQIKRLRAELSGSLLQFHIPARDAAHSTALFSKKHRARRDPNAALSEDRFHLEPEPILERPAMPTRFATAGYSLPTYSYALANPIRNTDPDGRFVAVLIPLVPIIIDAAAATAAIFGTITLAKVCADTFHKEKCNLIGSGGKGPKPGDKMRCTYECPSGKQREMYTTQDVCPQTFEFYIGN